MNMVRMTMNELDRDLTEEGIREIEAAARREPVMDGDSPEMSAGQLLQFRRMYGEDRTRPTVSIRLSRRTYDKARSYGKGYTAFLSRLLDEAINDEDMVRKCV